MHKFLRAAGFGALLTETDVYEFLRDKVIRPENLHTVIENGRLCALPEIAAQFRALKNESEGVADAYIESAYALNKKEVEQLLACLEKKFPGKKLNPIVTVNKDLIGGVCVRVGDQVLDGSVRARLAQMQQALTA